MSAASASSSCARSIAASAWWSRVSIPSENGAASLTAVRALSRRVRDGTVEDLPDGVRQDAWCASASQEIGVHAHVVLPSQEVAACDVAHFKVGRVARAAGTPWRVGALVLHAVRVGRRTRACRNFSGEPRRLLSYGPLGPHDTKTGTPMNRITALAATAAVAASSLALAAPAAQAAPPRPRLLGDAPRPTSTSPSPRRTPSRSAAASPPRPPARRSSSSSAWETRSAGVVTGNARIKANGTYKLTDKPSTPGSREYRVVKPGSNGLAKGFSDAVASRSTAGRSSPTAPPPATNFTSHGVTIGTEYYGPASRPSRPGTPPPPSTPSAASAPRCARRTPSPTLGHRLERRGRCRRTASRLATHPLAVGTIVADEELDLTGVFRLKLDATTSATPAATAAVATPEVLCTR